MTTELIQQEKTLIDIQVATAKAYPRNELNAKNKAIATVTNDIEIAKACLYAIPRKGKLITGPSVHLAKILMQSWGNFRAEAKVVEVTERHITSQAIAYDLENNLAVKIDVKRSIMTKTGRMSDDMITVTGNAANAIALRNAVYAVIPRDVIDEVYNSAKAKITGDISDEQKLIAKRLQVIEALKNLYNVTEEEILKAINKASVNQLTGDDIINLVGIGQAIKDGEITIEEAFRPEQAKNTKSPEEEETDRLRKWIENSKTLEELEQARNPIKTLKNQEMFSLFAKKAEELRKEAKKNV